MRIFRSIKTRIEKLESETCAKRDLIFYRHRDGDPEDQYKSLQKAIDDFVAKNGRKPVNAIYGAVQEYLWRK